MRKCPGQLSLLQVQHLSAKSDPTQRWRADVRLLLDQHAVMVLGARLGHQVLLQ